MAHMPEAHPNGVPILQGAAADLQPPPIVGQAHVVQGAAETQLAPNAKRPRIPRGPVAQGSSSKTNAAPVLLELAAAHPMRTIQRRKANFYTPDSQMLFHVLSLSDDLMCSTERFTRTCPSWLPIVSQLYMSILWNTHIIRVQVNSGYGSNLTSVLDVLLRRLRLDECAIPGPLIPFFQAVNATVGPFTWMGDISPRFPPISDLWDADANAPNESFARFIPCPALLLDQLAAFAVAPVVHGQNSTYLTFEWYSNVFQMPADNANPSYHIGPQTCGSLNVNHSQHDSARNFWASCLEGFQRFNCSEDQPPIATLSQFFGITDQNGRDQSRWIVPVLTIMQKYCQYFNGAVTLSSIPTAGLGAASVLGTPERSRFVSEWLYPEKENLKGFLSSRYDPLRPIPATLCVNFTHADKELEHNAEQFATVTHTNMKWSGITVTNNIFSAIDDADHHIGDYWKLRHHRENEAVQASSQFSHIIATRYHQQASNRAE